MDARDVNLDLLNRLNCEDSLREFIRQAWPIVEPRTKLLWARHLDAIVEHLEAVAAGDIRNLLINVMPRSGKSLWTSVFFPVWLWLKHPAERLVFVSYAAALAVKLSIDRRSIINANWFQKNWGARVRLADDANLKTEFQNTARGHMVASSVDASITGKGGNYVIVDDLINPAQANHDIEREGAIRWFDETLSSRLDNKQTGRVVVIEQRVHASDLSGHLLSQGGFTHLCLPAEFDRRVVIAMPRSQTTMTFEAGSLLWPEREGRAELDAAKLRLGSYAYNGQYLQNPTPRGGGLFKSAWLRRYSEWPRQFDRIVLSLDTAFKTTTSADYSAAIVIGEVKRRNGSANPGYYVLDIWRAKVELPELKVKVIRLYESYSPDAVLVEDAASGPSLLQELRRETALPLKAVRPDGDKFSRASACTPTVEAGLLYLPPDDAGEWVTAFVAELTGFPGAPNDDQVDAFCQAISYLRHQPEARVVVREFGEPPRFDSRRPRGGYQRPMGPTTNGCRFVAADDEGLPVPRSAPIAALPGHEVGGLLWKR